MNALAGWPHAESPWHPGEQILQARVGAREPLAEAGRRVIRGAMPQQHRDFFEQLPFIVAGAADAQGQPWATAWWGEPGFVRSPSDTQLQLDLRRVDAADPLQALLQHETPLGLLGIELATRRRNRANGRVLAADDHQLTMQVLQSFGNCPRYITPRALDVRPRPPGDGANAVTEGTNLTGVAAAIVRRSDTFFIATQALPEARNGGADVSHRGGPAGFVQLNAGGSELAWPDYAGNRFFNTLGNLAVEPRAGLLFIDFEAGHLLHVAGTVQQIWDGPLLETFEGAERVLHMKVHQWRLRRATWPWRLER